MHNISKNRWIRYIRKIIHLTWPFLLSAVVFLSTLFAVKNTGLVEHYYSMRIYPVIAKLFSCFSNSIPVSLWEVFWVLVILLIICGLILVVLKRIKFGWYCLRILQLLALLYSFFYILWGYNYFRQKIEFRFGWESPKTDEKVFRAVIDSIIMQTNRSYISISPSDYPKIDNLTEESYRRESRELGINYPNGIRRPKTILFSSFYGKLGIHGYFDPIFNEIHVNYYLLPMDYPFSIAHEKAHQFGFCSEAEASLVAFMVCVKSGDQRLKYSAYQSLLLYFLKDASGMKEYKEYLDKINSKVLQDLRFRQKYYLGRRNKTLSKLQTAANDAYLKANRIEKGVMNYDQVVALVISWYYNSDIRKGENNSDQANP